MAAHPTSRLPASMASEADDLAFRYRTLLAAQHILDAEFRAAAHPSRDDLYVQRLRRLKAYLRNSITALERRMEALGITPTETGPPSPGSTSDPPLPPAPPKRFARPYGPGFAE